MFIDFLMRQKGKEKRKKKEEKNKSERKGTQNEHTKRRGSKSELPDVKEKERKVGGK